MPCPCLLVAGFAVGIVGDIGDVQRGSHGPLRRDDHVWGGETWSRSEAQVFSGKWIVDEFTPGDDWDGPYYGADWGFAADPTVLVRAWINDKRLYIEHEAFPVGCELDDTPALFESAFACIFAPGAILRKEEVTYHPGFYRVH